MLGGKALLAGSRLPGEKARGRASDKLFSIPLAIGTDEALVRKQVGRS